MEAIGFHGLEIWQHRNPTAPRRRQAWMLLDFHRSSRQRKMKTDAWLKSSCNLLDKCTSHINKCKSSRRRHWKLFGEPTSLKGLGWNDYLNSNGAHQFQLSSAHLLQSMGDDFGKAIFCSRLSSFQQPRSSLFFVHLRTASIVSKTSLQSLKGSSANVGVLDGDMFWYSSSYDHS